MSRAFTLAATAAVALALGTLIGASLARAIDDAPTDPAPLVQVEIIDVREPGSGLTPNTLVELEDGRRRILRDWYGEPGDTFMLPEPTR